MPLYNRFKLKTAAAPDLKKYIGRTLVVEGKKVIIETVVGNFTTPTFLEINGTYLIGMLRFFAQMNHDHSITEEQFKAFEEMEFHGERMQRRKENLS